MGGFDHFENPSQLDHSARHVQLDYELRLGLRNLSSRVYVLLSRFGPRFEHVWAKVKDEKNFIPKFQILGFPGGSQRCHFQSLFLCMMNADAGVSGVFQVAGSSAKLIIESF